MKYYLVLKVPKTINNKGSDIKVQCTSQQWKCATYATLAQTQSEGEGAKHRHAIQQPCE